MHDIPGYGIGRQVGQKGPYRTFIGKRKSDGIQVIVKLPAPGLEASANPIEEFEIARDLNHRHIIRHMDLIRLEDTWGLVHEWFDGSPLGARIPDTGFDLESFLGMAIQIAKGVSEIHNRDIVHQGISPETVFISPDLNLIKIGDFSRSTHNAHLTRGDISGMGRNLAYISPEQTGRMNRYVDFRSDFYSLGILFYHMLTGTVPFVSKDPLEMVHWHIARQAAPLNEAQSAIPDFLSRIVTKLMAKNTEDRYQSARGILFDLEACRDHSFQAMADTPAGLKDFSDTFSIPQKLYGREPDLSLLDRQLNRVAQGDTVAVVVTGYSGIGKSSLVNELQKEILLKNAYFGAGKYEHQKKNVSYSAIALVFQSLIRQILGESDERIRLWRDRLKAAVGHNGQLIVDIIPELEMIIGNQQPVPALGPTQSQNRFNLVFQKFVAVFDQLAHPLVIFLDDLQWIDLASLSLIKLLVSEHLTKSFLFIGAYRSNEVDPSHPVATTLKNIENTGVTIEQIHLEPLGQESINLWVADTLKADPESTGKLSALVREKTGGNPFFIRSFLKDLHGGRLVRFSPENCWEWDMEEIVKKQPTDNVMELMVTNLKKLPGETCTLVSLASCLGTSFSQEVLAIVSGMERHDTVRKIKPALAAGMLFAQNGGYRFVHDKILEGAYSIIPKKDRPRIHLETGRHLVEHLSPAEIESNLFNIVEHLNRGLVLVRQKNETDKIRDLNLKAAQKALNSSAYKNAGYYFAQARELMPKESWDKDYQGTLAFYSQWAEAEYMSSNFKEAETLFQLILDHAQTLLDKSLIYQMILVYFENQKRFREAVDLSVTILNELSIDFPHPRKVTRADIETQRNRLFANIGQRNTHELIKIPAINDPVQDAAVGIMVSVIVPYWNTYPEALTYLAYETVNRSLEQGLGPKSAIAFSMLGSILIKEKQTTRLGYDLAAFAVSITERFEDPYYGTAARYMFYNHVVFWKKPLRWGLDNLIQAFHSGIETGNIQWASYCLNHYSMRLLMAGDPLESVKEVYDKYTDVIYRLKQDAPLTFFNPPRQAVDNLLGLARDNTLLKGRAFDEETGIASFYETRQFSAIGLAYTFKLLVYTVFKDFKAAWNLTRKKDCETYIRAATSQFQPYIGLCFFGIVLMRNFHRVSSQEQQQILEKTEQLIEEFGRYKAINPRNFTMMHRLLCAERFRITGQWALAADSCEKAIDESRSNQYLYFEALASELCAMVWQDRKKEAIAGEYTAHAFRAYEKWGCLPKLDQMKAAYPFLSSGPEKQADKTGTGTKAVDRLDINSVQKATFAISSQIRPDKVLEQLVRIIMENAGARKGYIILNTEKGPVVETGFDVESPLGKARFPGTVKDGDLVPDNIIQYVMRTGKNIILSDAAAKGDYVNLSWIRANQSRSILAMPIMFKNQVQGALFLENNLAPGIFSEQRVEMLSILLSQAAISLENARLFQESMDQRKELSNLRNYLANIIDSVSSTLIGVDTRGGVVLWNSQAVLKTGIDVDHALGRPLDQVVSGMDPDMANLLEAIRHGREILNLRREYYQNGEQCFEDISVFPLTAGEGKGAVIRIDDITRRVHMEEMMIQSEKMLSVGGLAAGMAHEINNPLGGMLQNAEVIRNRLTNPDMPANIKAAERAGCPMDAIVRYMEDRRIPDILQRIGEAGDRAAEIVRNMLDFSRKGGAENTPNDMATLIEDCIELASVDYDLKKSYDFKKLTITREFEPGLPAIPCDPGKIKQVVMNLLRNSSEAIKESMEERDSNAGEKPVMILRLNRARDGMVNIEIEDNGPGMTEAVRKRVFEPFFTTKPPGRGTGLGLSVSYFIITEDHGGRMRVESEPGKGTRFIMGLPMAENA